MNLFLWRHHRPEKPMRNAGAEKDEEMETTSSGLGSTGTPAVFPGLLFCLGFLMSVQSACQSERQPSEVPWPEGVFRAHSHGCWQTLTFST